VVSTRFISDPTFYKKLGVENLLAYLKDSEHTLFSTIHPLLKNQTEISTELAYRIQSLFYSEDNSSIDNDAANFEHIKNLSSDNGIIKLGQLYRSNQSIQEILSSDELNNYDIAVQVFLKHRKEFDSVINNIDVEKISNWQFFSSEVKPELKTIDNIELIEIKSNLLKAIEEKLEIKSLSIEINKEDIKRWLVSFKYPDKLKVEEKYSKKNELGINELGIFSDRKALKMIVIFFPEERCLKVHNDSTSGYINIFLCEVFSRAFLSNAELFIQNLLPYSFDLEIFKKIENISNTTKLKHSKEIKSISFDSVEFKPTKDSSELIRFKGFDDLSLSGLFKRHNSNSLEEAEIQELKIKFRFLGKGSRERILRITSANGINLKASESRDEIMRQCLITWGVLNVS
jgi:hypothetical protein